ncbi:3-hydroxyacyl-CoA dehydrogenase NAD-binding domain-containing protein [Massilia putida]|uniref:3-hydroxyacyl-CoA dehydrogenase NAD-binding domain-containing protein n=1 Tax=Massilia putida TaxID=1141883 RepID=UPI0009511F16|nr:3-hydroxyacyl-CoA dehydrogenase NAD-binding domain-containing protein [Massilia putida]
MYTTLNLEVGADGVAVVTIDVPGSTANVMTPAFRADLAAVIDRVGSDAGVVGAVITSAKADFMAGGDLKAMVEQFSAPLTKDEAFRIATLMSPLLRKLETSGKPFVAAINGPAMGGGLELALACHARVALDSPQVRLALPEVTLGLIPGAGGSQRLPRLIGVQKALPLLLKGTVLGVRQAEELGLVDNVAGADLVKVARSMVAAANPVQPWDRKGYQVPGGAGFFDVDLGAAYNLTATSIAKDTARNYPAPIALLTVVARGVMLPMDAALHLESCHFAKLVLDPVARNMVRTSFVSKGELDKLARRPRDIPPGKLSQVGVIGAGLMGGGVAQVCAAAGLEVRLVDATLEQAAAGKQRLADVYAKLVQRGRMAQDKVDGILARIVPTADYAQLSGCGLVVEAVFENREVKSQVFRKLQEVLAPDAIIASNTSSLPITGLAEGVSHPERFIGLHFFSPVDRMPLVEVVTGALTAERTLAHALDFIKLLRKTPIVVKDSRGFFTTRVISAYLTESMGMLAEGVKPALIDNAAKLAGMPIGPLSLVDELTIELGYNAMNQEKADLGEAWRAPPGYPVQHKFVAELDRKGRRYGKGFYDYIDGRKTLWPGLDAVYPPAPEQPAVDELKRRMLYIQSLEAARCFEEGVIADPAEGDVGSVLGIAFPAYTGGVFSLIDTVGIRTFVEQCEQLADRYGERYRPSAWLKARAARGEPFYPAASAA